MRQRLTDEGHVIPARDRITPEALGAHHKAEIEKWWPMTELGHVIAKRDEQTPEGLGAFHKAEMEKWWPIIKAANIKLE